MMDGRLYDVAILGTGMAGTILGAILAKHGARVVLFDAGVHPRFAVGESTVPLTSLNMSFLSERYGLPELEHISSPENIAAHVGTTSGIKRAFGYAYHHKGKELDPQETMQVGTSAKDENHLFRQDIDAYLLYVAMRYGAHVHQGVKTEGVEITKDGVRLETSLGSFHASYLVDGTGHNGVIARKYKLRQDPPQLQHHSRSLFTHMIDVGSFEDCTTNFLSVPWDQTTLHHLFKNN